jgi:hypothetical protein
MVLCVVVGVAYGEVKDCCTQEVINGKSRALCPLQDSGNGPHVKAAIVAALPLILETRWETESLGKVLLMKSEYGAISNSPVKSPADYRFILTDPSRVRLGGIQT